MITSIKYYKKAQLNNIQLDLEFESSNNKKYKVDCI